MSDESSSTQPDPADTVREPDGTSAATQRGPHQDAPARPKDLATRAKAAIESSTHASALVDLARDTWIERAATGRSLTIADVREKAEALSLSETAANTSLGNAILILGRGPQDATERALGTALCTEAIAREWSLENADDARLAAATIFLSTSTEFDAIGGLDRTFEGDAARVWKAIAARVRKFDRGEAKGMSRGEAAVACAALAHSTNTAAAVCRADLRLNDAMLAGIVSEPAPSPKVELSGELLPAPRSALATTLLALTGILFFMHALRLIARLVLVYRRPAEVTLSRSGVRVRNKTMMLGRILRETETHITRESLAQASREVRYPSLGLYAGLLALAIGSYVGVGTLSDGIRSASPSLLLVGLVIVAAGISLDLVLTSASPGMRGRCRVVFVSVKGPAICVGRVDSVRADLALAVLKA